MTIAVNVSSVNEIAGWRASLVVLAIERWQELLEDLGVPAEIAASPEAVHRAASHHWQISLALQDVRSLGSEDYRLTMETMLRDFFTQVAADYSDLLATELRRWAFRQYVNDQDRNSFLLWTQVLRRLAGIAGLGYPLSVIPIAQEIVEQIKRSVESHLNLEQQSADAVHLDALSSRPESALEHLLVARGSALLETVRTGLLEALTNQRAYQTLAEILPNMDPGDREKFLEWARRQATTMQMPAHLVTLPAFSDLS